MKKFVFILLIPVIFFSYAGSEKMSLHIPPAENDVKRETLDWYATLGAIRTATTDNAIVFVDIAIGYEKGDKIVATELSEKRIEIKDFLKAYFALKPSEKLSPEYEDSIRLEFLDMINSAILTESKIVEIRFLQLDIAKK